MEKLILDGPEAKGFAQIEEKDGKRFLNLIDLWVARGAPDVQVALSGNPHGHLDDTLDHVSELSYSKNNFTFDITDKNIENVKSIIVYCQIYRAHFGHATIKE